ncbi:DUF6585 family protein [Dactylosporangium matsuzakiense]|uniref:Uncharacterized protein n=1 Tax=Dactylosporangium matsuzakiense TaxID=53360 RepID=A0A9W6KU82_9ACTN|nr:DUF6585 family protein [Dactylosporangium matsuzakiense]UWZ47618.1 hypothetical protein Dmats_15150 [Dactylosporangium matsuzakiense]GLL05559.1 hypothetical protein GCM10017581_073060 [Dactylosporangium matsuzakiense]
MIPQFRMAVICAVMGVIFLGMTGFLVSGTGDVTCGDGGKVMSPGDICVRTADDGTRLVQDYDEVRAADQRQGGIIGGLLVAGFFGLAVQQVLAGQRRKRERAAAQVATRAILSVPMPPDGAAPAPAAPPQAIPADAVQAAYAAQLGGYTCSMQPGKRSAMLLWLGVFALICIALLVATAGKGAAPLVIFGALTVVSVGGFAWTLARSPLVSKQARQLGFHLFQHGFVRATAAGVQAYRWDQIISIYQSIIRQQVYGATTNTNYAYLLDFADGRSLALNNFSADMAVLGPILQEQVARVQVPRAVRYLHSGHAIPFGAYTVTAAGVTNRGRQAPWTDVAGVKIENGGLRLQRPGGKAILGGRKIRDVPNFLTFVTLVGAMAGSRPPATAPAAF